MPIPHPSRKNIRQTDVLPHTDWFHKIENSREAVQAEADRDITENKVQNEEKISRQLKSIHFEASALPPEVLEEKTYAEQPFGDIELHIYDAIERIENNTQKYTGLAISKIDNGIYQIAFLAKQAIDMGNAYAALAACHALSVTIGEIRDKIHFVPAVLQKDFMDSAEQYIGIWIDCILHGTVLDGLQNNANAREAAINSTQKALEKEKDGIADKLEKDSDYRGMYQRMKYEQYTIHGSTWDAGMIELYRQLLDLRMKHSSLELEILRHNEAVMLCRMHWKILEDIMTELKTVPSLLDPHLICKFHELIHKASMKMNEQKQQFEEFFWEMDRTDTETASLVNTPMNIRAKEEVSKQIEILVEQAKKKQLEMYDIPNNGLKIRLHPAEEKQKQQSAKDTTEQT